MRDRFLAIPAGLRHMIIAAFFFSMMSALVKILGRSLPTAEIVFFRCLSGLILARAQLHHAGVHPWGNRRGLLILRAFFGLIGLFSFFYAITHLSLADATVIQYTNPVIAALLAGFLLREHPRPIEVIGVLGCLVGVILVSRPAFLFGASSAGYTPLAIAASITGAIASAFAYITVRKLGETEHHLVTVFYFPMIATPVALVLAVPTMMWPSAFDWLLLFFLGGVTHVGQMQLTLGLQKERTGRALSMAYLQIVFAVIWGVTLFSEWPDWIALGGMAVIMGCTALVAQDPPPKAALSEEGV